MTDNGTGGIAMDSSIESSTDEDNQAIGKTRTEIDFRKMERDRDIQLYKKLLSVQTRISEGHPAEILQVLASSDEIGDERVLLGSLTLVTVLHSECSSKDVTNLLKNCWNLEKPFLSAFQENVHIRDLEWFQLAMTHGYLQFHVENIHSPEMMLAAFEIPRRSCLTYTKYSYVAYKILQTWMNKSLEMNFWFELETNEIESKLEAIIFSNWDNCINKIARRNASQIFPTYLKIMSEKYEGFLKYISKNCIENLSWQNVTKYTILVEVCKISCNLSWIMNSGLAACIFTSLTKNDLKQAGTSLYSTILRNIRVNEWENIFAQDFFRISAHWESEKELAAITLLWEQWMKPTIQKFPYIFEYLWNHESMKGLELSRLFLARMGDQRALQAIYDDESFSKMLDFYMADISETTRLNAFAIIARNSNWTGADPFGIVKKYLYFNANASTIFMRKGIIENFKTFFAKVAKLSDDNDFLNVEVRELIDWLHKFFLDCCEIGASYQRKILGLTLYGVILNFTFDDSVDGVSTRGTKFVATLKSANSLRRLMVEQGNWKLNDHESAMLLMRLALDQADDIRDRAASILIRYFDPDVFSSSEKKVLVETSLKLCQSSRVPDIAGGSAVLKVLRAWKCDIDWMDGTLMYEDWFVDAAIRQLSNVKKDILKSATEGSSFFGALTIILELGLSNETLKILDLVEEATSFFLSALSPDDKNNEYSSSFKDMSIAVEAAIKNSEMDEGNEVNEECNLSSAHQIVVSCIWMSLKVSCDLAAEIGCRGETKEIVERAATVIVSVLLKCRHKGAIEAAGLALAKLTKVCCSRNNDRVLKNHLENLLSIDNNDNINLTRRGAGLTIMFHRIVSSDVRYNRPFVHLAAAILLKSLKSKNFQCPEYCQSDSTCARHLHFLRALVADKSLQGHLVQYMEQVCLLCFEYLQSPEWTVRNASLQLFGALVPRLVGQCSPKDLDYGIGNSIDHFVTHYANLATSILDELEAFTEFCNGGESDFSTVSKIVPILTLLSKMSTAGCDHVDYSSKGYRARGKEIFSRLLAHPVFHVRGLAAKAYAAFVPLSDIHRELIAMKMEKIDGNHDNYNHGQLLAQFYLKRKCEYETRSTSDSSTIRKHETYQKQFENAVRVQMARAEYCWKKETYALSGAPRECYTIHRLSCFPISTMLLSCLIDCPVALSILKTQETSASRETYDHQFIASLFDKKTHDSPMPGLSEFLETMIAFKSQLFVCPYSRRFYMNHARTAKHHAIFMKTAEDLSENFLLENLVANALDTVNDSRKIDTLLHELSTILDILRERGVSEKSKKDLKILGDSLRNIDENSEHCCAEKLRNFGHMIAMYTQITNEDMFQSTISYLWKIMEPVNDLVTTKYLVIDCLSLLVGKLFSQNENIFDFSVENPCMGKFICIITTLLTDEDAEARELASDKLSPLTRKISGQSDNSFCSRASLFKILTELSSTWAHDSAIRPCDCYKIFELIINSIKIKESTKALKSPYEEDDTFQRDNTELLNILVYCVGLLNKEQKLEKQEVDLQHINGTILVKYKLKELDAHFTNLSTWRYLMMKKKDLIGKMWG